MNTQTTTPVVKAARRRQPVPAHQHQRLSAEDILGLKQAAVARWPGVWLHHFGILIEEEILRRHGIDFTSTLPEAA